MELVDGILIITTDRSRNDLVKMSMPELFEWEYTWLNMCAICAPFTVFKILM